MANNPKYENKIFIPENKAFDVGPIEPKKKKVPGRVLIKWSLFLVIVVYILISFYQVPILTYIGKYLIVEHPPQKSDLIVCMAGGNIERGLATADAYNEKLAPWIFIAREELPDGYKLLLEKGVKYPESIELLKMILYGLGIPGSALIIKDHPTKSTISEAIMVRKLVKKRGFRSLIIITSPFHSRRAWLTFKKVFEKEDVRILMLPSKYSEFRPGDWWKRRKYVRSVIIEYEKLVYYVLKYYLGPSINETTALSSVQFSPAEAGLQDQGNRGVQAQRGQKRPFLDGHYL